VGFVLEQYLKVDEWLGKIILYTGSMNSGKTEDLVSIMHKIIHSGHFAVALTNDINSRDPKDKIVSAGRYFFPAHSIRHNHVVEDTIERLAEIEHDTSRKIDVVGFSESQFLPREQFIPLLKQLTDVTKPNPKLVIIEGIDLDFRGENFGAMKDILFLADYIRKNPTYCKMLRNGKRCRRPDARYNARLLRRDLFGFEEGFDVEANFGEDSPDGSVNSVRGEYKFAPYFDKTVRVEITQDESAKHGKEMRYVNACKHCFRIPGDAETKTVVDYINNASMNCKPLSKEELVSGQKEIKHLKEIVEFLVNERRVIFDGKFKHVQYLKDDSYSFFTPAIGQKFPKSDESGHEEYYFDKNGFVLNKM
jgi:thymidine kinase